MHISRRTFTLGTASIALTGLSSGRLHAASHMDEQALYEAAKSEGVAVMYVSAPLDPMRAMLESFQSKYPGVTVELQRLVSTQQYQKFLSESQAGQNIADVLQLSDKPAVDDLIGRGLIADHKVPTDAEFSEPGFKIPGKAYVPWSTDVVITYNTGLVSEEDAALLKDWKGILDPRFKGKIAMRAKLDGAGYAPFLYLLDEKKDEYGEAYMEALAAQEPKIFADPVQAGRAVQTGELAVWFPGWESLSIQFVREGAPIRWVFPNPSPAYGNVWTFINASAPHPNAARLLQNWWASDDAATVIETIYLARASKGGRADSREVTKESWYEGIGDKGWLPDPVRWSQSRAMIDELWKKHFGRFGAI
jgi:ABC-type Fe3+ transport system substrate-binding protein